MRIQHGRHAQGAELTVTGTGGAGVNSLDGRKDTEVSV